MRSSRRKVRGNERVRRSRRRKAMRLAYLARVARALALDLQHLSHVAKRHPWQVGDPSFDFTQLLNPLATLDPLGLVGPKVLPFLSRSRSGRRFVADPRFVGRWRRLRYILSEGGHPVTVTSAYRSLADQQQLIQRWERGDPDIITEPAPPGESAHQYGFAIDVVTDDYDVLGEEAEKVGLVQPDPENDPVHIELPGWRDLTDNFSEGGLVAI